MTARKSARQKPSEGSGSITTSELKVELNTENKMEQEFEKLKSSFEGMLENKFPQEIKELTLELGKIINERDDKKIRESSVIEWKPVKSALTKQG